MSPNPPAAAPSMRWTILALLSLALFGNYYVYDSIAPVADLLTEGLGFSDMQLGTLNAIYSAPNVVLVLIGGLLVDRYGAAKVALATALLCLVGAVVTAAAQDFASMAFGRLLFGMGAETLLVACMVPLARWFSGATIAFAMALNTSIARLGSYAADVSPDVAAPVYAQGWQAALWLAAAMALLSLVGVIGYAWIERRHAHRLPARATSEPRFAWRDVWRFDRSYWYVLALCVLFYSAIFPFRSTFAVMYFQHSEGLSLAEAGVMNSHVFLAAVFATPLFGWIADRFGHRALLLAFGALLLSASFVLLATSSGHALAATVLLGISFSLVPAVLWPAVAFLTTPGRLGTAFGLMTMLQNLGMVAGNLIAGALNDAAGAGADNAAGYVPMLWFFAAITASGFVFALLLWRRELGPASHGMERPVAAPKGA
jgi:MFS family permease